MPMDRRSGVMLLAQKPAGSNASSRTVFYLSSAKRKSSPPAKISSGEPNRALTARAFQKTPSGIPLGNVQAGFGWLEFYKKELGELTFPSDGDESNPYPIYDRWGDSFNLSQEFVILNQARALAYTAWLMAQTSLKNQPWKAQ